MRRQEIEQSHLHDLLEALRGKTIIEKITLGYAALNMPRRLGFGLGTEVVFDRKGCRIELLFQPVFITYVQWPYYAKVSQVQQAAGAAASVTILARQLFEESGSCFVLDFSVSGVVFQDTRNIEETLFLDLQRFCEHSGIPYEVR